jgi:hypothetical protein
MEEVACVRAVRVVGSHFDSRSVRLVHVAFRSVSHERVVDPDANRLPRRPPRNQTQETTPITTCSTWQVSGAISNLSNRCKHTPRVPEPLLTHTIMGSGERAGGCLPRTSTYTSYMRVGRIRSRRALFRLGRGGRTVPRASSELNFDPPRFSPEEKISAVEISG